MIATLKNLRLYWHTILHLRPIQIYGRIRYRLTNPKVDGSAAPGVRTATDCWIRSAKRNVSMTGPESFLFLGEAGNLEKDGWDNVSRTKLWRYNQHYFDDLNGFEAEVRAEWHSELVGRWIADNPPPAEGIGGTGWEPYPTSLRIVNWIKWVRSGGNLSASALQSLAVQVRWLSKRLEWHILGNHLFVNAKALIFAASFYDGPEAEQWLTVGADILLSKGEIAEQILEDGGQFELSPMYHLLAVEDLLDILNALRSVSGSWTDFGERIANKLILAAELRLPSMLGWMQVMAHPDDKISFFNDSAFGVAPELSEIKRYAEALGFVSNLALGETTHLQSSGYARLETGPAVLLTDFARVGPDYLPGHAHADTLSFELSLYGKRVFVNSGTSVYGVSSERLRQRGTAAHNTVVVKGMDSSEVWSGFRVARRAQVTEIDVAKIEGALTAKATHDGYRRLPDGPYHTRYWVLGAGQLFVKDFLSSSSEAEARYHLHPEAEIFKDGLLILPGGQKARWQSEGGAVRVEQSSWHPEFGVSRPNQCLVVPLKNGYGSLRLTWVDAN